MIKKYGFLALVLLVGLIYVGKYLYFMPKYVNGEPAPEIEFTDLSGKKMKLSDFRGQYVLVDFWGSWCGPCRQENPDLVKLYDQFSGKSFTNAKDFTVISIALETNEPSWRRAIQRDDLHWPYHYSEFKRMKSPIAQAFGVREIPTKYLVNPRGDIAGVNQTFDELTKFLKDRLR